MTRGIYMMGWWFSRGDTLPNGDNRKIVIGKTLKVKPPLVMCVHGLHASARALDALVYAHGAWLHRVRLSGDIIRQPDKACATKRTVLARIDATTLLQSFTRQCARDVIHLWDAPQVVRRYLESGEETIRLPAREAIWTSLRKVDYSYSMMAAQRKTNYLMVAALWAARTALPATSEGSNAFWSAAWAAEESAKAMSWEAGGAALAAFWEDKVVQFEKLCLAAIHGDRR